MRWIALHRDRLVLFLLRYQLKEHRMLLDRGYGSSWKPGLGHPFKRYNYLDQHDLDMCVLDVRLN